MSEAVQSLTSVDRGQLAWWSALSNTGDESSFTTAWLALQAHQLPGVRHAVLVLGTPDTGPFKTAARHPEDSDPEISFYDVVNEALQRREVAVNQQDEALVVAYPVLLADQLHGVVGIETTHRTPEALIQKIRWGLGVLESWLLRTEAHRESQTVERMMTVIDSTARALKEGRARDVELALVTNLAARLDCDRVSMGLRRHKRSTVHALSHSSKFAKNMDLMRAVAEAMDKAIDQNTTLCLPRDANRNVQLHAHRHLARKFGNAHVLTVPFAADKHGRGALVFERPDDQPFDPALIELCQSVVLLVGRILYQRRQQERLPWVRAHDALLRECGRLLGPTHVGRKLLFLAFIAVLLFGTFAHGIFRVTAPATIRAVERRTVSVPFNSYISKAFHRAGDVVDQGEVLARLDTHDIKLQLLQAANRRVQYRSTAQKAMARGLSAKAAIAKAQVRQATAQIRFYRGQIERAAIRAPFDGILVSGNLSQELGEAVKRGQELFKISPMDRYRLLINVPAKAIDEVEAGQTGHVVLASMPDRNIAFTVHRIVPLARVKEGKSVFRVQAELDIDKPQLLRPGMQGAGKIDIGQRRYVWIWLHPIIDWLRLQWWAWFG